MASPAPKSSFLLAIVGALALLAGLAVVGGAGTLFVLFQIQQAENDTVIELQLIPEPAPEGVALEDDGRPIGRDTAEEPSGGAFSGLSPVPEAEAEAGVDTGGPAVAPAPAPAKSKGKGAKAKGGKGGKGKGGKGKGKGGKGKGAKAKAPKATPAPAPAAAPAKKECKPDSPYITQTGERSWNVKESWVDRMTKDHNAAAKLASVGWARSKEGKIIGFRIKSLPCASPLREAGFMKGDIIRSVNGKEITSTASAMRVGLEVKRAGDMRVNIKRGSGSRDHRYHMVK
jgi:hypothetical protein